MEKSQLRKTDENVKFALAAVTQAMEDAKLTEYNPEDLSVVAVMEWFYG